MSPRRVSVCYREYVGMTFHSASATLMSTCLMYHRMIKKPKHIFQSFETLRDLVLSRLAS